MKLHLPKLLLTAVLAACTVSTAWGTMTGWGNDSKDGGLYTRYYIDRAGSGAENDAVINIDAQGSDKRSNFNIYADVDNLTSTVNTLKLKDQGQVTLTQNPWVSNKDRVFTSLTIKDISVANAGAASIINSTGGYNGTKNNLTIVNTSSGALNINNTGTLTLGATTADTINLAGTLVNTGELTVKGTLKVSDLSNFTTGVIGGELSETVNGYRTGYEAYLIINGSETSTINKDTATFDITGKTADDLLWVGNQLGVKTGNTTTTTIYEIHDTTAGAVVYDEAAEKWGDATEIQMYSGTKLQLQTALADSLSDGITVKGANSIIELTEGVEHVHSKVTTEAGQKVSYTLDGATLNINTTTTNISAITLTNKSTVTMPGAGTSLGTANSRVQISMSGESALSLSNGSWGNVYADINVDGSAKLLGSWQGNYLNVQGTINGSGTLTLGKPEGNKYNSWTISSTISDKSDTEKLSIVHTANTVTLSGNNSYSGGTTITGGTVNATHANALGTGSVTVNGGNLEITGENAIEGAELNITNGTVTATYDPNDNKSVIKHETAVKINTGGTLHLKGHDTLGYENSVAPEITLASTDSTKKATLKFEDNTSATLGATINMNGNAQIIGNKINTFGTTLTVTNKNNEVSVETIEMRTQGGIYSWDVDVAKDGELTLSSQLVAYNNENATLNKSNEGKLIVTGTESTWSGSMNVTGGTLQLKDNATLGLATVVMSSGTTLETGTGTIAALTLNAGSKLVADDAVQMAVNFVQDDVLITQGGTLTLGGTITLNGGLLSALQSLQAGETLELFTNVDSLVLGKATYAKGTDILDANSNIDLEDWFILTNREVVEAIDAAADAPTNLGGGYYLGYDANGTVFVGMMVPEPTTATLSLLALAGLAARRRRK